MSLLCARTRRLLERSAAVGAPEPLEDAAAQHLEGCAACRAYAAEIARLSAVLDAALPHVQPRPALTERILSNLETRAPAVRSGPWRSRLAWGSLAAAAAAALALWILWPAASPLAPARRGARVSGGAPAVAARVAPSPPATRSQPVRVARSHGPATRPTAQNTGAAVAHRQRRSVVTSVRTARSAPRTAGSSSATWANIARWYALWGDPLRAARAYEVAVSLESAPDPALTMEAGRAAETGGDVGAALEYYIRVLDSSNRNGAFEQKGSLRWHEDRSSRPSRALS